ncbi:hypothetical protein ISCGN_012025 [Ixodes scapularis]
MKALVSGAACSTCGKCELAVQESVAKRKGLASFLELCCQNDACPTSVLSSTYSSRRASAAENVSGEPCGETRNGSSRDSDAVNVKAVVAARAIGVGHKQLSRFCVLLGLPKPMHHKTFAGITKKVHLAPTKAAAVNLELSRRMTAEEVETTQVAVMFGDDVVETSKCLSDEAIVASVRAADNGESNDYDDAVEEPTKVLPSQEAQRMIQSLRDFCFRGDTSR